MPDTRWEDVYRYEDNNDGTTVTLEQLTREVGVIPGALILNVEPGTDGGPGAWASLPYAELRRLRDVLTEWIEHP